MSPGLFIPFALLSLSLTAAQPNSIITDVEAQPLLAQTRRLREALDHFGAPLSAADTAALEQAAQRPSTEVAEAVQAVLDAHVLYSVHINPEMRVKVTPGPAAPDLVQNGWRSFLVKVHNEAGTTAQLKVASPQAQRLHGASAESVPDRWLDLDMADAPPMTRTLSGLNLEYRIVQLYSRDAGRREARVGFNVGQGTQDIGYRNEVDLLFHAAPAREIPLHILDDQGQPTIAALIIKDSQGRIYPSPNKRLAPDFSFHPQVYRADGESLQLPDGPYTIEFSRGPESIPELRPVNVGPKTGTQSFRMRRWIDPAATGWWSGDHHIHAAGCAHYSKPTEGVHAPDMYRHCVGEDLKIGANLTWGPCFDYQKQFFTGADDKVSQWPYLLRYDVEVSGFGSHQSGHLCLLRLKSQIYPGGDSLHHWPTLGLNTLKWAKAQGAVCGPAHSGWGLQVDSTELPNYIIPPFDGIGANEYIVNVTHLVPDPHGQPVPAVDFMSLVDTPPVWELNIWYHTLNCGFRTRVSGETDFPCIYGERVGLGRSYVKLDGRLNYDDWCEGIRQGRSYVGDGRSHLLDFAVNDQPLGVRGSELRLSQPGQVRVTAKIAALLPEQPHPTIRGLTRGVPPYGSDQDRPFWSIDRARIEGTREVPIEVIVNGYPVAKTRILADGSLRDFSIDVPIERSSWVALRILPSSHTNPIWVLVNDQPVRASRRSAEWCLKSVDQCWSQKERFIAKNEMKDALAAYEHARQTYQRILSEADTD